MSNHRSQLTSAAALDPFLQSRIDHSFRAISDQCKLFVDCRSFDYWPVSRVTVSGVQWTHRRIGGLFVFDGNVVPGGWVTCHFGSFSTVVDCSSIVDQFVPTVHTNG